MSSQIDWGIIGNIAAVVSAVGTTIGVVLVAIQIMMMLKSAKKAQPKKASNDSIFKGNLIVVGFFLSGLFIYCASANALSPIAIFFVALATSVLITWIPLAWAAEVLDHAFNPKESK